MILFSVIVLHMGTYIQEANDVYNNGVGLHRQGDLAQAAACYEKVLSLQQDHSDLEEQVGLPCDNKKSRTRIAAALQERAAPAKSICERNAQSVSDGVNMSSSFSAK